MGRQHATSTSVDRKLRRDSLRPMKLGFRQSQPLITSVLQSSQIDLVRLPHSATKDPIIKGLCLVRRRLLPLFLHQVSTVVGSLLSLALSSTATTFSDGSIAAPTIPPTVDLVSLTHLGAVAY